MTAWTVSSCSEEVLSHEVSKDSKFHINAYLPNSSNLSTRTTYVQDEYEGLQTQWEGGDQIQVYGLTSTNSFTFNYSFPIESETSNAAAVWANETAGYSFGETLVAVYPSSAVEGTTASIDFSNQDGTLASLKNYDLMLSEKIPYDSEDVHFYFYRLNVFLRIEVDKALVGGDPTGITISLTGNKINRATLTDITDSTSYRLVGTNNITVECNNPAENEMYYLYYVSVPCNTNGIVPLTNITINKSGVNIKNKTFNGNLEFYPGYLYATRLDNINNVVLLPGPVFNSALQSLSNNIVRIYFHDTPPSESLANIPNERKRLVSVSGRNYVNAWAVLKEIPNTPNAIIDIYPESSVKIEANSNSSEMFANLRYLTAISNLQLINTEKVTDMSKMFLNCIKLNNTGTSSDPNPLNISLFDTRGVKDFSSMFEGCTSLVKMDIGTFDVKSAQTMSSMFKGCTNITRINVDFKGGKGPQMKDLSSMFMNCTKLTTLRISGFRTDKVELLNSMFENCTSIKSIDISSFKTAKTTNMYRMFFNCPSLTDLNLGPQYQFKKVKGNYEQSLYGLNTTLPITITCTQAVHDEITDPANIATFGITPNNHITWINATTGQIMQ